MRVPNLTETFKFLEELINKVGVQIGVDLHFVVLRFAKPPRTFILSMLASFISKSKVLRKSSDWQQLRFVKNESQILELGIPGML